MFKDAAKFNQDISRWDVKKVKDAESMFEGASSFQTRKDVCGGSFCICLPQKGARALGEYWAKNSVVLRQLRKSSPNVAIDPKWL